MSRGRERKGPDQDGVGGSLEPGKALGQGINRRDAKGSHRNSSIIRVRGRKEGVGHGKRSRA